MKKKNTTTTTNNRPYIATMKFSCLVLTAVLTVTSSSMFAHAFVVNGSSHHQVATTRAVITTSLNVAAEKTTAAEVTQGNVEAAVEECSNSWFDNNDGMADCIFDTIDTDEDGTVSNGELQDYLEEIVGVSHSPKSIRLLFATLDQNADGCISRDEMRFAFSNYDIMALYEAFGITGTSKKMVAGKDIRSDAVIKQSIDKLRSDANIDPRASPAMLNILADLMFDKIDTDNSGEIDVAELKEHYEWNGEEEKKNADEIGESAKSILAALDLNSDGKISREEMRAGFNQFNPKSLSKALGVREAFEEASNSSLKKKK